MSNFITGNGREFYLEQLEYLAKNDIEGLLMDHYHKDAVLITFDGIRKGHDELRQYFVNTLASMGAITQLKTEYYVETEDVILFKATITDEKRGTVKADDALYMKDGKIFRHMALTLLPNFDYNKFGTVWND